MSYFLTSSKLYLSRKKKEALSSKSGGKLSPLRKTNKEMYHSATPLDLDLKTLQ